MSMSINPLGDHRGPLLEGQYVPRTSARTSLSVQNEDSFDFLELWRALLRRRRVVLWTTIVLFLLMAVYCLVAARRYSASAEIEVQKPARDSLGLGSALGIADAGGEDSLLVNIDIQTQSNLLESQGLALQVVNELNLEHSPDFKPTFNPLGYVMGLVAPKGHPDRKGAPLAERPNRRETILRMFKKNLKVEPVPGTRLIDVSYLSQNPQTARAVVNQLVHDLVQNSFDNRPSVTGGSSKFMDDELAGLRANTERLQDQVARMQQQAGIVSLGTTDTAGREQAYSAVLDQLQQISTTLGEAQTNRILKQAVYEQVKSGNPELISNLSGNLTTAASTSVSTSLNMIQNLRIEEATEKVNLDQMEAKFGSAYPRLQETRDRIAGYEQAIHDEIDRMRARSKNDYDIAVQTEAGARQQYDQLKVQADAVNNSAINYAIAKEEAESSRKLYEDLLSRSKEAEILAGLKTSDIGVVNPALLPGRPARPRVAIYLAAAIFLGLTLGAGLAILIDLADKRVMTIDSVRSRFGRSPAGIIPLLPARAASPLLPSRATAEMNLTGGPGVGPNLAVFTLPESSYAEAVRALAGSLMMSGNPGSAQVFLVTSPVGGEGKTSLTANLAGVLARQGKRVLAIDADLRHPDLHHWLKLTNSSGLTSLVSQSWHAGASLEGLQVQAVPEQPELFALTTGPVSTHPSEVLGRAPLGDLLTLFRGSYDCIIMDAAPVLTVNDSIPLLAYADKVLLVARLGLTKKHALVDALTKLGEVVPADDLKLVINAAQRGPGHRATYYGDAK